MYHCRDGFGYWSCSRGGSDIPVPGKEARIIWSSLSLMGVYGWNICRAVEEVNKNAVAIDTKKQGRLDLLRIVLELCGGGSRGGVCD